MKSNTAIVGIDGVLAETEWRRNITDYSESIEASISDYPYLDMLQMLHALHIADWRIVGITNRPEKFRPVTTGWLSAVCAPLDELLMRPNDEYGNASEVKLMLAQQRFGDDLAAHVRLAIDDRDDVLALFAARGITTLLVNGRN